MTDYFQKAAYRPSAWGNSFHQRKENEVFGAGAAGPGKSLCLKTLVPTPVGFRYFKDIHPGDIVYNVHGQKVKVLAETPIWENRDCFEILVADEKIICDGEHLWCLQDGRIQTAHEIHNSVFNTQLSFAGAVEMDSSRQLLDPYIYGLCLVRGQPSDRSKMLIWHADLYHQCALVGYTLDAVGFKAAQIRERRDAINELIPAKGRRIHKEYLYASFNQRMAVVEGIMDANGGRCPEVDYEDYPFLTDFYCLCASLGLGPQIKRTRYGKTYYVEIFSKDYKCSRLAGNAGATRRRRSAHRIKRIKRCLSVPTKCIQVEGGGTFLITKSYIPTHNSMVLLMDPVEQIQVEHLRCQQDDKLLAKSGLDPDMQELIRRNPIRWGHSEGWVLHLRRTLPRLSETINRAHRIFPQLDPEAKWNEKNHFWTFSSGIKYEFGHCKDRTDYNNYLGKQYCVAKDTNIVMGDGSLKPIQSIVAGEQVMTLEGPKTVSATWNGGIKPCVRATTKYRGVTVGTQVHPSTHPVLLWPNAGLNLRQLLDCNQSVLQSSNHVPIWHDYESLLYGYQESPENRASLLGPEISASEFRGSHQETRQLPRLTVPVVLHERTLLSALSRLNSSKVCHTSSESLSGSESSSQPQKRLEIDSFSESKTSGESSLPTPDFSQDCRACGGPCVRLAREKARDFLKSYSSCSGLHGEQLRKGLDAFQSRVQQLAGVALHDSSILSLLDDQDTLLLYSRCYAPSIYANFYTGQNRSLTEAVRRGSLDLEFVGYFQTYDLTVEDANHYITETGVVNCQTHLGFDELVEFDKEQYDFICSRLRTGDAVLEKFLKIRAMSNPKLGGNKGEDIVVSDPAWVKRYFVDPAPEGRKVLRRKVVRQDGRIEYVTRIYIPATLYDNPDKRFVEQYELQLMSRPKHIRDAYLYGRWDAIMGSHFGETWNPTVHVCKPFKIPHDWPIFRAGDWGYATHGTVGWYAVHPEGTLYCFYELSFRQKTATEVAEMIKYFEEKNKLWDPNQGSKITGPMDKQLWEERGSSFKNKAEEMADVGVFWVKADQKSREVNHEVFTQRLLAHKNFTQLPGIVFFENCDKSIKTIPALNTDSDNPEVTLKGGEDHWLDRNMYACQYAKMQGMEPPKYKSKHYDDEDDHPPDNFRDTTYSW